MLYCSKLSFFWCIVTEWMRKNAMRLLRKSVLPESLWAKRSLFEISSVFIPSVMCVTCCNWHTLKNATYLFEICTTGWGDRYLCGLFYCCSQLHPILPVYDPLLCCYLHLVILVIPICMSRLLQTWSDWLIVTYIFSCLFLVGCSHAYSWCLQLLVLVATVTTSHSGCCCIL